MKGADRFGSRTWLCSFLLNTAVNWPLNSFACSSSSSATPLPFTLGVFLLTIYVSIKVSGISLNVSNQVTDIQIVLLFDIGLYFRSQSFKFWPKFTIASLFRFCMCFISSTNLPSYLRGYPRDRRYWPTGFRGDMLISRLLNKGSYQIKVFLNSAIIRVTIEVPIFCKVRRIFPHRRKISFLIQIHLPPRFLFGGNVNFQSSWHDIMITKFVWGMYFLKLTRKRSEN